MHRTGKDHSRTAHPNPWQSTCPCHRSRRNREQVIEREGRRSNASWLLPAALRILTLGRMPDARFPYRHPRRQPKLAEVSYDFNRQSRKNVRTVAVEFSGSESLSTVIMTVAIAALVLIPFTPATAAGTHPRTGEALADDQTFTYRMPITFATLDPQLSQDAAGFHAILDLFEGLLNQDSHGELVPGVATQYVASDGGMTYTFTLRKDARWSNGDAVTANDFVYAWRRAADPATASPYGWYVELAGIVNAGEILAGNRSATDLGVRAIDASTLEVRLTEPRPYFPAMTTYATLFPVHQATLDAHGDEWTAPGKMTSNGAYTLGELVPNEYHTRDRNPFYWGADTVIIDQVTGLVITDANEALSQYRDGHLDQLEPLPPDSFQPLRRSFRTKPPACHSCARTTTSSIIPRAEISLSAMHGCAGRSALRSTVMQLSMNW